MDHQKLIMIGIFLCFLCFAFIFLLLILDEHVKTRREAQEAEYQKWSQEHGLVRKETK